MKFLSYFLISVVTAALFTGCDEGRIYNVTEIVFQRGLVADINITVSNSDNWADGYSFAVAGFENGSDYALISKNLILDKDGSCHTILSGIPVSTNSIEICIIDRLRRRVTSFLSLTCDASADTIHITADIADASQSAAVKKEIIQSSCTQCHGATGFAAAGLDLTGGDSLAQMINTKSSKIENSWRIKSGDAESSVLYNILSTNLSSTWRYDHSVEITSLLKLDLLKTWIDNLPKDNNL